jgi:cyclopropane fatty-acyl-phospholipid synthase-like methyltransferase
MTHFNFVEDYPKIKTIKDAKAWICTNDPDFKPDPILSLLPLKGSDHILDFGCGIGRNLVVLLSRTGADIIGYDHPNMTELAREYLGLEIWHSITFLNPPIAEIMRFRYNLVISTLVFMHMREDELLTVLPVLAHCLTDNGLMYCHCRTFTDDRGVLCWPIILKYFEPVKNFTPKIDLAKLSHYDEPKILLKVRK